MPITAETYQQVALEDPESGWELDRGRLREKPSMSALHNDLSMYLGHQLIQHLDPDTYRVRTNVGRLKYTDESYFIPDVCVVPVSLLRPDWRRSTALEIYEAPLPLVIEVWSPSTGDYDIDTKFPQYERRGDEEIWRIQPYDRSVLIRRRQAIGTYTLEEHAGGQIPVRSLPGVTIDMDRLFAV